MKTFLITYYYTRCGSVEVKAESLEQAKDLAGELSIANLNNEFYVDDSFEVDDEFSHEVKDESSELV
jgi:hypothetical protein